MSPVVLAMRLVEHDKRRPAMLFRVAAARFASGDASEADLTEAATAYLNNVEKLLA